MEKAVKYLVDNQATVPHNTAGALAYIYDTLKKSEYFDSLVERYPNLKLVGAAKSPRENIMYQNKKGNGLAVWHTL